MLQRSFYIHKENGSVEAVTHCLTGGSRQKSFHQEMTMQVGLPHTQQNRQVFCSVLTSQDDTVQEDYYLLSSREVHK